MREPVVLRRAHGDLSAVLYHPATTARTHSPIGVVLCHSFAGEKYDTQRFIVEGARRLQLLGMYCLIFDYSGSGNSEGSFYQNTLQSQIEDIQTAVQFLGRQLGVTTIGLLGLRLGATLAARVAATDSEITFLALWDPVLDPKGYFETMFIRRRVLEDLQHKSGSAKTMNDIRQTLLVGQQLDFNGYAIGGQLYRELATWQFWNPISDFDGHVYLLNILLPGTKNQDGGTIVRNYFPNSIFVEESITVDKPMWWKETDYKKHVNNEENIAEKTALWMQKHITPCTIPQGSYRSKKMSLPHSLSAINETNVLIPNGPYHMLGTLHQATNNRGCDQEGLLFADFHSGRTGRNDIFVESARALGTIGFSSLRFDFLGRGDSEGLSRAVSPSSLVADMLISIDYFMKALDLKRVNIISNCYASFTAIYAACICPYVDSLILWAIPSLLFELPELQQIEVKAQGKHITFSFSQAITLFQGPIHFVYDHDDRNLEVCQKHVEKTFSGLDKRVWPTFHVIEGPSFSVHWKRLVIEKTRDILMSAVDRQ